MQSIRTVNLMWEKRQRGTYPPSPSALNSEGIMALATPRPLEPRTYDYCVYGADGAAVARWGFSVETLIKMSASLTDSCLGMTSDDLYMFHNRNKVRFLSDKHINYIDAALSADGTRAAAAFSDLAGDSFAVACGDIDGKLIWVEEFDAPITVVGISGDGTRIAVGLETGTLSLLDSTRRNLWNFELEAAVCSTACSADGAFTAYAAADGSVGLIRADGARVWDSKVQGDVVAISIADGGALCAVLTASPDDPGRSATIRCLTEGGTEGWQHDTERRCTGISVSPNGTFLAVGSRDGVVSLYGVVEGEHAGATEADAPDTVIARARELAGAGDAASASRALKSALALDPANLELYREYLSTREAWRRDAMQQAAKATQDGDCSTAIRVSAAVLEEDPLCVEAAQVLRAAREARCAALMDRAIVDEAAENLDAAEASLREAIAVAPCEMDGPRNALAQLLSKKAISADAEADELERSGKLESALNSLERVQAVRYSAERSKRIRKLQVECEFARGMEAYNAKLYSQAIFQFKKVLQLDGDHAEALRHLEFARHFSQDASTGNLQDRFSRLE